MKQTLSYCVNYDTYHWYLDNDYFRAVRGWTDIDFLKQLGYRVESLPNYPEHDPDVYDFFDHDDKHRFAPPQSRMILLQQFTAYKKHKQQQRMSQLLEEMKTLSKEMVP